MNAPTAPAVIEKKELHVFFGSIPSMKYILKNGKICNFIGGRYTTDLAHEIAELEEEITLGNPHMFINDQLRTMSKAELDPLHALKKRAIEEYLAQQAAASQLDAGTTVDAKSSAGMATTQSLAAVAAGGTSGVKVTLPPGKH